MRVEGVDERDSSWEDDQPRFRVYLFERSRPESSWTTDTYDIEDADVLEVIRWAETRAGADRLYAVALVGERTTEREGERRGLTWLLGMDANDTLTNDHDRSVYERMLARRGKRIVAEE